mmetsp:Transcript_22662/g.52898  ORF Transcript_22662/g.52898 Transcript_22662/m.52898 type:complete len:245 (-) Transcript_22662:7-741(-)
MQSTKSILNEVIGQQVPRKSSNESTMPKDYDFAELAIGEKQQLLPKVVHTAHGVWHSLLDNTQQCRWIFGAWTVEVVWMLFVTMLASVEMWSACPLEFGSLTCHHCYSGTFLTWQAIVIALWAFSLYTFVLLVSRGFSMSLKRLGSVFPDNLNKGIPALPIVLLMAFLVALLLTLAFGIVLLLHSHTCRHGDALYAHRSRSPLLFCSTLLTIIAAPVLVASGRCVDVGRRIWGCCENSPETSLI